MKIKSYFLHLLYNWGIAGTAFSLFILHFLHGIIPCKFTSYKWWGIYLTYTTKSEGQNGND
jgi:hypothetical protein